MGPVGDFLELYIVQKHRRYYEPDAPEVATARPTMQPSCCDATAAYLSNSFSASTSLQQEFRVVEQEAWIILYLPAPSKRCQLNPKGLSELTPFINHLAPFGRSRYVDLFCV